MKENLYILKSYINILDNETSINHNLILAKHYFILLHNFLLIERMFQDDVNIAGKQLNVNLNITKLNNKTEVYNKFVELYDRYNIIRNNVETFDSCEPVRKYLTANPKVYRELL